MVNLRNISNKRTKRSVFTKVIKLNFIRVLKSMRIFGEDIEKKQETRAMLVLYPFR